MVPLGGSEGGGRKIRGSCRGDKPGKFFCSERGGRNTHVQQCNRRKCRATGSQGIRSVWPVRSN